MSLFLTRLKQRRSAKVWMAGIGTGLAVITLVGSTLTASAAPRSGDFSLMMSSASNRSNAQLITTNSPVSGKVAIFVQTKQRIRTVAFYLDDTSRKHAPRSLETQAPFDFATTASDGTATLFDTASLKPGVHYISALVTPQSGGSTYLASSIRVSAPLPTTTTTMATTTTSTTATSVAPATTTTQPPAITTTTTAKPTTTTTTQPPLVESNDFPTLATTGPRTASLTSSGDITSSGPGQVFANLDITGNVRVAHDNVIVRDSRIRFTATHGIDVVKKSDGTCPVGVLFEYIDLDGQLAAESDIPIYSSGGCGWTVDHAYVHNVGRSSRLTNNDTISNSYIFSNRSGDSGSHRGAAGTNGGSNNKLINNVLFCASERGCSAAIPMYGDFAPVDGMLVQHNLLATTGGYCTYGGSLSGKPYPNGSNVKFIDNHFSTQFSTKCGQYGPISGFANNVRGNEWRGNVWHETGLPVNP